MLHPPKSFAVGITTAPRRDSTLARCVRSTIDAGFQPTVFAEPNTNLDGLPGVPVVQRERRFGAWHNWRAMCGELLETGAEAIVTIQDDVVFTKGVREFLEANLWPDDPGRVGFVMLYVPRHYATWFAVWQGERRISEHMHDGPAHKRANRRQGLRTVKPIAKPPGLHEINARSLWGACALVFPRETLQRIIEHKTAREWKGISGKRRASERKKELRERPPTAVKHVDTAIGHVTKALGLRQFAVSPSLAQHVAEHSAVGNGGLGGRREAADFPGEDFDARTIVVEPTPKQFTTLPQEKPSAAAFEGEHFVITRFALKWIDGGYNSLEWLRFRLALFKKFLLPTMRSQTEKRFTWLVLCDQETPAEIHEQLDAVSADFEQLVVLYLDGDTARAQLDQANKWIKRHAASEWVLQSRVDSDDCLSPHFLATVRKHAQERRHLVVLDHGFKWFGNRRVVRYRNTANMFLSLVERRETMETIYRESHIDLPDQLPAVHVAQGRHWCIVCHGANVSNEPNTSGRGFSERLMRERNYACDWSAPMPQRPTASLPRTKDARMFSSLAKYARVVVTGPQRSGTTIAAKMIAHDTGYTLIDEMDLTPKQSPRNRRITLARLFLKAAPRFVLHCPDLMRWCDEVGDEQTLVVVVRRPIEEIIASQNRIGWSQHEPACLADYGAKQGPIAKVRYEHFDRHQRDKIPHLLELDYASLADHPLWVPKPHRSQFAAKQTAPHRRMSGNERQPARG